MTSRLAGAFPGQDPTSREDVAKTIMEILQGQEDTLGASSPTPRPMMKLPARCFRDLAPGGALFVIMKRCLTRKHEGRWRRFDWQSEHKRREFVGMMVECEDDLRAKGLLGHAKIHVSSDVPAEKRAELARLRKTCGKDTCNDDELEQRSWNKSALVPALHFSAGNTSAGKVFLALRSPCARRANNTWSAAGRCSRYERPAASDATTSASVSNPSVQKPAAWNLRV